MALNAKFVANKLIHMEGCVAKRGEAVSSEQYAAQKAKRLKEAEEKRLKNKKEKEKKKR